MINFYYPYINDEGLVTLICAQPNSRLRYDCTRFRYNEDGNIVKFYEKEDACDWLIENIKFEKIDKKYMVREESNRKWKDYLK